MRQYKLLAIIMCGLIGAALMAAFFIFNTFFSVGTIDAREVLIYMFSYFILFMLFSFVLLLTFQLVAKIFHFLPRVFRILLIPPIEAVVGALIFVLIIYLTVYASLLFGLENDPLAYIAVFYYGPIVLIGILACSFMNELVTIDNKWIKGILILMCSISASILLIPHILGRSLKGDKIYILIIPIVIVCISKIMYVNKILPYSPQDKGTI